MTGVDPASTEWHDIMSRTAVAIPTRNRSQYLGQALESVLAQTRVPSLVVVSDDASTDGTPAVVEKYRARFAEAGTALRSLRHDPPLGQEANRRAAFVAANADLVAMLDDDDLWDPRFLQITQDALDVNPEAAFAATGCRVIDGAGRDMPDETRRLDDFCGRPSLAPGLCRDWAIRFSRVPHWGLGECLFRRAPLAELGFIPAGSDLVCDYALFIALAITGASCVWLPEPLHGYRLHPGDRASDRPIEVTKQRERFLERAVRQPVEPRLHRGLIAAGRHVHLALAMTLGHRGQRRQAVLEGVRLVRVWGVRADVRRLLLLPLLLLGADRVRAAGHRMSVRHHPYPGAEGREPRQRWM